jgi:hypothetical protein
MVGVSWMFFVDEGEPLKLLLGTRSTHCSCEVDGHMTDKIRGIKFIGFSFELAQEQHFLRSTRPQV